MQISAWLLSISLKTPRFLDSYIAQAIHRSDRKATGMCLPHKCGRGYRGNPLNEEHKNNAIP